MKYIIDTHYVLWTLFEPEKIDNDILAIVKNPPPKEVALLAASKRGPILGAGLLRAAPSLPDTLHSALSFSRPDLPY